MLFDDHDRRSRPRHKLPRCRPLGLVLQRRRRGTRPTTSSVDSTAVRRRASRLCRRRSPRPCTSLIAPRLGLRRSETQRFRSTKALVVKPLFTNDQWGPPIHRNAFRLNEMAVVAALQPSFSADNKLTLDAAWWRPSLALRRRLTAPHVHPLVRRGKGLSRRDHCPRQSLPVATGAHTGPL